MDHASSACTTFSTGRPGRSPSLTGATAARSSSDTAGGASSGRRRPRLRRRDERPHQGGGHPGVGLDGVLGRLVARNRRTEDQPPLVRVLEGPATQGARDGQPVLGLAGRPPLLVGPRLVRRPLGLGGQRLVGGQDERAQQGVAAVEVPVQRRRGHSQVAGDGAQGEGRRTVTGEVGRGHGQDLRGHLLPDPLPGRARRPTLPAAGEPTDRIRGGVDMRSV